jgi:hypothetical protein
LGHSVLLGRFTLVFEEGALAKAARDLWNWSALGAHTVILEQGKELR